MSRRRRSFAAFAALLGAAAPPAAAQSEGDATPPARRSTPTELDAVTVTARPFPSALFDLADPVDLLEGRELLLKTQPTLGQTLANEPGVSATYFGPSASAPIIRGLGGFDIRVLNNGLGVVDASAASPTTPSRCRRSQSTAWKSCAAPRRSCTAATPSAAW